MTSGLAITRSKKNSELHFFVKDLNGEIIEIKQTVEVVNNQVKVLITASAKCEDK